MEKTALESWWLNNVAVLPEYQGNGIATSLLDEVLKKVG
jgi:ribosomal protein S18 acetylase RimI-like enzyme